MSLLIALCTLVIQLLASVPGTQALRGWPSVQPSADAPASSASIATAVHGATSVGVAPDDDASIRDVGARASVVWVRAVQHGAGVFAARSATVLHGSPAVAAAARLSAEATFASSVRVRTLDASHELSARGALLPYFPTAPPLQS